MSVPDHAIDLDIEVPFHDCDPLFVVWHGRYFQYLQIAHSALLRSHQLDVPDLIALGYRMVVTDTRCRYTFPLTFGDIVRVQAWFTSATPCLRVAYTLRNLTKHRVTARAYTVTATTDRDGNLFAQTPDDIRSRLPL
ncbi:MAG: acyl-CoA thioesterase [Myxococcales bacterium FL481]|nr:MAG: acyl-CoA thioesterase [Myxococcales bacterium FL481]